MKIQEIEGRFADEPVANWGAYAYIKVNTLRVVREQLTAGRSARIDRYHGVEARPFDPGDPLRVRRRGLPGTVSIRTKSPIGPSAKQTAGRVTCHRFS